MPLARELLDEARRRERLQLALLLVLELPARHVVDEDERLERLGRAAISATSVVQAKSAVRGVTFRSDSCTRSIGQRLPIEAP